MERAELLGDVLRAVAELDWQGAAAACRHEPDGDRDSSALALESFSLFIGARFDEAGDRARTALDRADGDPTLTLLALAAASLAESGGAERVLGGSADPGPAAVDVIAERWRTLTASAAAAGPGPVFAVYLAAESALASARISLARDIAQHLPRTTIESFLDEGHPYRTVMGLMLTRILAFGGAIAEATATARWCAELPPLTLPLVAATAGMVGGNAAETALARGAADTLEDRAPVPGDYLSRGCYLLAAYGLVAIGDVARAARFVVTAGGSADLDELTLVDRALGFELLTAAAVADHDRSAAEAWASRAAHLADLRVCRPTVERIRCRIALLAGEVDDALALAESAVAHAAEDGRAIEEAEATVLLSRARIAAAEPGRASSSLNDLANRAADTGHAAARNAAARELRGIGRRLAPSADSGWAGLSDREREVALLVAEGFSNSQIAAQLQLSQHTVRTHVSRVLAAYGAASRFVVASRILQALKSGVGATADTGSGVRPGTGTGPSAARLSESAEHAPLTAQQLIVAGLVAEGMRNEVIADRLDIGTGTVEKHVAEIFRRWSVTSRIGIAAIMLQDGD